MEKKYLQDYKRMLANLSEKDKKLRDLYLRKLSLGEIQGPPTGYVSIDKPWLKYYDEQEIMRDFEPMSAYQLMMSRNIGHEDEIAIDYYGNKISYGQLFENIDLVAKSLLELGIKSDDVVLMSMPNTPESEYLFYAINKIGAVANCIDPRSGLESFKEEINNFNIKYLFGIDVIYDAIKDISDDIKIINISPFDSMPFIIKQQLLMNSKDVILNDGDIKWDDFILLGNKSKIKEVLPVYSENKMAAIVHTGGTTGTPKGVMLTNEQMNGLIYQMMYGYSEFKRGQVFLNFMPTFIALGLNNSTHLSACFGLYSVMIPSFEPEDMPELLLKYKPNIFLCGPMHLPIIMRNENMQNADLSFLNVICSGGEKLSRKLQESFQEFLREHNSSANMWIGYGATETSAGIACMKNNCFTFESVGIPYLKNNIALYDLETGEEICGYDKQGEIRINAPTIMDGYCGKNASETDEVISVDEFNDKWYHTGDIGHVDDGLLYIDGRIKQIIYRKAFKIYPQPIEKIILESPFVKECSVVGVEDEDEFRIPVANIVLKSEYFGNSEVENQVREYVDNRMREELQDYTCLAGYNFISILPRTAIGKVNFKELEKLGIIKGKKRVLSRSNYVDSMVNR